MSTSFFSFTAFFTETSIEFSQVIILHLLFKVLKDKKYNPPTKRLVPVTPYNFEKFPQILQDILYSHGIGYQLQTHQGFLFVAQS